MYKEVLTSVDRFTAEAHMHFADESICLLANNVRNEVVAIHRSQKVLKILSLSTHRHSLQWWKLFCRNILQFCYEYFLLVTLPFRGYCCKLSPSNNSRRKIHKN
jgi:hypothetical protein